MSKTAVNIMGWFIIVVGVVGFAFFFTTAVFFNEHLINVCGEEKREEWKSDDWLHRAMYAKAKGDMWVGGPTAINLSVALVCILMIMAGFYLLFRTGGVFVRADRLTANVQSEGAD